jgi:hypothetical protein
VKGLLVFMMVDYAGNPADAKRMNAEASDLESDDLNRLPARRTLGWPLPGKNAVQPTYGQLDAMPLCQGSLDRCELGTSRPHGTGGADGLLLMRIKDKLTILADTEAERHFAAEVAAPLSLILLRLRYPLSDTVTFGLGHGRQDGEHQLERLVGQVRIRWRNSISIRYWFTSINRSMRNGHWNEGGFRRRKNTE